MKNKFTSFLAPITLLEWGGILLYFHLSGRLSAFLHPSFRPQVLIAGIVLVLCAVTLLVTRNKTAICACGIVENCPERTRSPLFSNWIFPLMLLLPLGIAATFTRDAYGSNILATRGITDNAASLPGLNDKYAKKLPAPTTARAPVIEPALPDTNPSATASNPPATEDPTAADFFKPDANGHIQVNVADLLYAAEEPTLRGPFAGKSAQVVGQFMPAKTANPTGNRFKLVRLFMTCCAADAQPISLLIEHEGELPAKVSEMTWTKVTGDITFPLENGRTIAIIKAKKIEPVDPPEETMLY